MRITHRIVRPSIIYLTALAVTCALIFITGCIPEPKSDAAEQKPLKVLFIGNSYTSVGDLPEVITQMAKAKGKQIEYTAHTPGGRSLQKHWHQGKAQQLIARGGWDIVVLQDQSLNPAVNPENTLKYAGLFCKKIDEVGAKKVFYLTFAYKDVQAWLSQVKESKEKKRLAQLLPKMQSLLNKTYLKAARQNNAIVAPVGIAWDMAYSQNPQYPLHASDNSHPDKLGVYLTALVFYAAFFDEMPVDMPGKIEISIDNNDGRKTVISVEDETRKKLEKIAWEAGVDVLR